MAEKRAMRPVAAAAVVLVDDSGPAPHFLMGRRADDMAFMPGYYVFPGGRVERIDSALILGAPPLAEHHADRLAQCIGGRSTARRAQIIAAAGLRELSEEADYRPCYGVREPLVPLCRAITPPGMSRRYDTCFFLGFRRDFEVGGRTPDGEIGNISWRSVEDHERLQVHDVTRFVTSRALAFLALPADRREQFAVHTRRMVRGTSRISVFDPMA